jgi:nucleotide-binding universal stress UspA family protein
MFSRVLFTTDGSQFAERALTTALGLAQQCSAELRVVTVVENPVFYGVPEATALYDADFYRSLSTELEKLAKAALERAEAAAEKAGVPVSTTVRHGTPGDEVIAEARQWGADVVVLSTHGRSGLARLLLGSVANNVVNHAPCPVLLCRLGDGAEASQAAG